MISFHAMMTNFVGAGIIPVYATFAEMFVVSVQDISYFTSIHVRSVDLYYGLLLTNDDRFCSLGSRRSSSSLFLAALVGVLSGSFAHCARQYVISDVQRAIATRRCSSVAFSDRCLSVLQSP